LFIVETLKQSANLNIIFYSKMEKSMIKYKKGNILKDNSEAIVNLVNCIRVMGKGLALQFKKKYPENFEVYAKACKNNEVNIGKMFVFDRNEDINPKYIINFPTKKHWRGKSKIEFIDLGLEDLVKVIEIYSIKSIAIPLPGSGLGGLDWNVVNLKIEDYLKGLDCDIMVYEPI